MRGRRFFRSMQAGRHSSNLISNTRQIEHDALRQLYSYLPGLSDLSDPKAMVLEIGATCDRLDDPAERRSICHLRYHIPECPRCRHNAKFLIDFKVCPLPLVIQASDAESMDKIVHTFCMENHKSIKAGKDEITALFYDPDYRRTGNFKLRAGPLPKPGSSRKFDYKI